MKPFEPIPVYPLRMRGRFGLTRHLYRNGFGGAFCFSLVYVLIIALLAALCLAPLGFAILRSDTVQSLMDALTQNLPQEIPMIPGVEGYDWQFSFGEFSGAAFNTAGILLRSLGTVILLLVLWGGVTFFLHPLYQSTMYAEMNARVHGQACSFAEMWQRSMPCLRANYATYIALLVGKIGAGIVSSFGAQLLSLFSGLLALFAVAMPVFGFGVLLPLMTGLGACMGLAVSSFILLTFPVGVAEPNKDFSALGRSIKLGFHNFWRIFSSLLLRELYIWLLMLPGACLLVAGIFIADNRVAIPLLVLGVLWMLFVRVYFMGFRIAFDTALYQDMTARENIPPLHAQPVNAQPVNAQPAQASAQPAPGETPSASSPTQDAQPEAPLPEAPIQETKE